MASDLASILLGSEAAQLRIVRKLSKAEVGLVAQYCALVSADKLIESLAFPTINHTEYTMIRTELDARLLRLNGNEPNHLDG